MISLRAKTADDNPSGTSTFVGIPLPIGVRDGDLILVAITTPDPVDVTPPDESWTKIVRTDPTRPVSVAVYWKFASNEPAHWVFALSGSSKAAGAALVYGNADGFEPVDASGIALTLSSVNHNVSGISPSFDGEVAVLFAAADLTTTFSALTGFVQEVLAGQSGACTLSAQDRSLPSSAAIAATTVIAANSSDGASVMVAVRPGVGKLSVDDVRRQVIRGFPRGVERVYDLAAGGDYYKYFQAWAQVLKTYAYDLADLLRLEVTPYLSRYKLPEWEQVFGLTTSRTTRAGTFPQRQQQVLGSWRAAAGQPPTAENISAVVGALLGYFPTTPAQTVECLRSDLNVENTYTTLVPFTVADTATGTDTVSEPVDGGAVSQAGARLILEFVSGSGAYVVTLTAPDATAKTWDVDVPSGTAMLILFGAEFAGKVLQGPWTLQIHNVSGSSVTVLWSVLVEGIARDQETGGAIFDWGVYADPAHLAESGVPADFAAARLAIQKLAYAHTVGNLLQSLVPLPDVDEGASSAIPDECIPTL